MPIDPNIPLAFHPTPTSVIDPNSPEYLSKQATVQGQRQENQLGAIKVQQAQQDQADQASFRQAWMQSGGDLDKARDAAVKSGVGPRFLMGLDKQRIEHAEALAKLGKGELENRAARNNQLSGYLAPVAAETDPQKQEQLWNQQNQAAVQAGLLKPNEVTPYPGAEGVANHVASLKTNDQLIKEATQKTAAGRAKTEADKFALERPALEAKNVTAAQEVASRTVDPVGNQDQWDAWRARQAPSAQASIPAMFSPAAKAQVQRMAVPVKDQPTFDLNTKRASMGLMGNSEYDQVLGNYARGLNKTVTQLTPEEGMASVQKFNELKQGPQQTLQSYKLHNDELDKLGKPIDEVATKVGDLRDLIATGDSGNPQAWANVPAKVLSLTAGGQGSGLRMSTALLDQELGGAGKWAQLQGAFQAWNPDPKNASKISDAQKAQFRAILNAAEKRVQARQDIVNQGRQDLIDAKDINGHRSVVLGTRNKLAAADRAAGGQGGGQSAPAAGGHTIGETVPIKGGKKIKITAIHGDGTFDGDEVKQ